VQYHSDSFSVFDCSQDRLHAGICLGKSVGFVCFLINATMKIICSVYQVSDRTKRPVGGVLGQASTILTE
jgi:hypothetical protein